MSLMGQSGKTELKHLLNASGEWVGELDPVLAMDDAFVAATGAGATLKTVATGKTLFAYAFLIGNISTTKASYAVHVGGVATPKLSNVILGEDVHQIPEGPNPRAPILKFSAGESVKARSSGTTSGPTVVVTMSFWEAELE